MSYGLRVYDVYSIKNEKSILGHKIIICSKNGLCVKGFKFKVYNVYSIKKTLWVIRSFVYLESEIWVKGLSLGYEGE